MIYIIVVFNLHDSSSNRIFNVYVTKSVAEYDR